MDQLLLHLAPSERWRAWPAGQPYLPAEYERDGFVHCTAGDELLLRVANHHYQATPGKFVLLVIDQQLLTAPVRWEAPPDGLAPAFPHIYGPIDLAAIVAVRPVRRAPNGLFLGWYSEEQQS
jgi:uncharacterized protein (DUF952 family)